jgi:hypothetical protein
MRAEAPPASIIRDPTTPQMSGKDDADADAGKDDDMPKRQTVYNEQRCSATRLSKRYAKRTSPSMLTFA